MSIKVVRETHETPESLREQLRRAGGVNRFGEPNYRAVWGWSRLAWIGGKWTDHDASGNAIRERIELRQEPKYLPIERWHIERWISPEEYGSPRQWRAQTTEFVDGIAIPALGPYPSRGDYEHCFTLQTPRGEFLALTSNVCDYAARAVAYSLRTAARARELATRRREERVARSWDARADDILDDAVPAFHRQPFVTVGP